MLELTMQQQSVLVLACRGPDGIAKFHPTKEVVAHYRATVLKAAYLGRAMRVDEGDDTTFMTLRNFSSDIHWVTLTANFFSHADELPHHYYMHLMHGAEIIGYKHPELLFRERWLGFYVRCCHDLHLNPETAQQMDLRLNDWDQRHWKDGNMTDIQIDEKLIEELARGACVYQVRPCPGKPCGCCIQRAKEIIERSPLLRSALSQSVPAIPAGWRIVPEEPTEAMLEAALDISGQRIAPYKAQTECGIPIEDDMTEEDAAKLNEEFKAAHSDVYGAMLSAVPSLPKLEQGSEKTSQEASP